jgi:UTP--glucose-1-phosphate uridylyltransferase
MMDVRKAVFPVAGLGSRFLPATKANPKEMLPVVDKPLIQYAVEEAIEAGITHMIFITSFSKRAIEDHFDTNFELESRLIKQGKNEFLDIVRSIAPNNIHFSYMRQSEPLGLGHAVLCAQHAVGDEPFAVLLADDLMDNQQAHCLSTMKELFQTTGHSVIALEEVPWDDVEKYGIVNLASTKDQYSPIVNIVEKPKKEKASSNLAVIGRYIFTPTIFSFLKQISADKNGEIQLTDGIAQLCQNHCVLGYKSQSTRYDCGSKLGYLQATVQFGRRHPEIGQDFINYLKNL